jgi:hypothetical protein
MFVAGRAGAADAQPLPEPERRIVLIDPGAELESAARAALEPWALEIAVVSAPSPGATAPGTHESARALALAYGAGAVVWVSEHEQGYAVWVYDLETNQVVARPLAGPPPFDGPAAAAAALSVKTLLRHSATAPLGERYGAGDAGAQDAAVVPAPAPAATELKVPAELGASSSAPRAAPATLAEADADAGEPEASGRDALMTTRLELEAASGARFGLTGSGTTEARFGAAVALWPAASALGFWLRAALGPAVEIDEPGFDGALFDASAVAGARLRFAPLHRLRLSAGAGAGAHVTSLDGALVDDAQAVDVQRVVPALDLDLAGDWLVVGAFRVGLRGGASWLLRPQRYLVHGQPQLELARIALEAGLTAGLLLP